MTQTERSPLTPEQIASLLRASVQARERGDIAGARSLLRALNVRYPGEVRFWLARATVAETRDEQREALERALALDPDNTLARRGLARFATLDRGRTTPIVAAGAPGSAAAPARPSPRVTTPLEPPPSTSYVPPEVAPLEPEADEAEAEDVQAPRWPLYLVIGIALAVLALAALMIRPWESARQPEPTARPTVPLPGVVVVATPATQPTVGQMPTTAPEPTADAAIQPTAAQEQSTAAPAASPAAPTTAAEATLTPPEVALRPGEIITSDSWRVTLLRPEHAVTLDGAIGPLQPQGRFVLALVSVSNVGPAGARIPDDLVALEDSQGNRYLPLPAASTAYLDTFGRAQRGDLSQEEPIAPELGNVSVPIIFEVPQDARGLRVFAGESPAGWPVQDSP